MNLPNAGFCRGKRKLSQLGYCLDQKGNKDDTIRSVAHAFHSTGSDDGIVAEFDALGSEYDRLHTACADLVDGGSVGS